MTTAVWMAGLAEKDDILLEARKAFQDAESFEADNRSQYREDVAFARAGDQWPSAIARKRRKEGIPVVMEKFEKNVARVFAPKQRDRIMAVCLDQGKLEATPVNEFMDLLAL